MLQGAGGFGQELSVAILKEGKMGEVVQFANAKEIATAILEDDLNKIRVMILDMAEAHIKRVAPHLFEDKDLNPEIIKELFAASVFQMSSTQLVEHACERARSIEELRRANKILIEIL